MHSSVQPVSLGDDWRSADFHVGMSSALRVPTGIPMAGRATAMGKGAIEVAEGLQLERLATESSQIYSVLNGATWCCIGWPLNQHSPNSQLAISGTSLKFLLFCFSYHSPFSMWVKFFKKWLAYILIYPVSDPVSYNWYRKRCHMPCPMIGKNDPQSIALARHWRIRKWSTQRHTVFFWA